MAFFLAVGSGSLPGQAAAQDPLPPDTYRDPATRDLVERAVAGRRAGALGIQSYEATLRQRMYVGVTALRFRRERGVFENERIARIRWSDTGEQAIQWIGVRTAIPIAGIDTGDPEQSRGGNAPPRRGEVSAGVDEDTARDLAEGLADDYLDETDFPGFDFDPAADRMRFGDDWAFHPLADTSLAHYRYAPGDTLRIQLPANERSIVLYEVRVEPRRADFELLAGSLWLDSTSASLVRATYRPARPWSLRLDGPEEADVPGFIGPIEAEIRYITVESSLQELQFWLPRRFAFQGEARAGGLFRMPITIEWNVGGYIVNASPFDLLVEGELPEGWQRKVTTETDDDGVETTITVVVPTSRELRESPALSDDFGQRSPVSFSEAEIEALANELQGLLPTYQRFRPRLSWGVQQGQFRFNRVEGMSLGAAAAMPLAPDFYLDFSARVGTGDQVPNLAGGLRFGPETSEWTFGGHYRLASMNDRDDPFSLTSSAMNLAFGSDRGEYYRAGGAELGYLRRGSSVRMDLGGFYERQRSVDRSTTADFSLRGLLREDTVSTVLQADDIDVLGLRAGLGWFVGSDPSGWVLTGALSGDVGFGDARYQRTDARLSVAHPLFLGLAGVLEVGAGTSWGELPLQRHFFLGSSPTLRGFHSNEHFGAAFWRARGELATAFPGARVGLFSDLGWVGSRDAFRLDDPLASVGIGVSLLDGLVRFDVARAVRGADRWKVHLYLDGLF